MLQRLGSALFVLCLVLVTPPGPPAGASPVSPGLKARSVDLGGMSRGSIPLAFEATHVAWSWRGAEEPPLFFRTLWGEGRSPWQRVEESHDMSHGDRHYSGVVAVEAAGLVEWRLGWAASQVRGLTLDYIDAGRSLPLPTPAAKAGEPVIVTRAGWGADESIKRTTGDCERRFWPLQQLFVHHTAGANFDRDPAATMRAIAWYHTVRRGWCDVGYNFVIGWDGTVFEGRWARSYGPWETHSGESRDGRVVAGAHVADLNSGSLGVAVMGNFTSIDAPPPVRRSLAELLAWEADRHELDPLGKHVYRNPDTGARMRLPVIAGHRDAGQTSCPGNRLYRALPDIRRDTAAAVGAGKKTSSLSLSAPAPFAYAGDTVYVSGTLSGGAGEPLPFSRIVLYSRTGLEPWREAGETTTTADGTFTFSQQADAKLRTVAVFDGDARSWGAQSPMVRVKVRPRISLAAEGGSDDGVGTWHFPPGTSSVRLSGGIDPPHPGHPVTLRLHRVEEDGTLLLWTKLEIESLDDGTFAYDFAVPEPGVRFRATAHFVHDRDHASSVSPEVFLVVDP